MAQGHFVKKTNSKIMNEDDAVLASELENAMNNTNDELTCEIAGAIESVSARSLEVRRCVFFTYYTCYFFNYIVLTNTLFLFLTRCTCATET